MATTYKLIRVESELYKQLAELAKLDHRTITQYVNLMLANAIDGQRAKKEA